MNIYIVNILLLNIFSWLPHASTFALTVRPNPPWVALTYKVAGVELPLAGVRSLRREEHVTGVGVLPGTAPVAVAQLAAAAAGVGPQGADVGTQNSLNIVLEKFALMLGGMGDKQSGLQITHTHTQTRDSSDVTHLRFGKR